MAGTQTAATTSRPMVWTVFVIGGYIFLALVAAAAFPRIDRALNPSAAAPGLISFLGTGLAVLALTVVLLTLISIWPLKSFTFTSGVK